eukprot:1598850-Rhodomonas_salina.1
MLSTCQNELVTDTHLRLYRGTVDATPQFPKQHGLRERRHRERILGHRRPPRKPCRHPSRPCPRRRRGRSPGRPRA